MGLEGEEKRAEHASLSENRTAGGISVRKSSSERGAEAQVCVFGKMVLNAESTVSRWLRAGWRPGMIASSMDWFA